MSAWRDPREQSETAATLELLTITETARALRVSPTTVRRLIGSGRLAKVQIGRSVRVSRNAVETLASAGKLERDRPESAVTPGRPLTLDDPIFELMGIGDSAGPGDVAENVDSYLADACLTSS